MPSIFNSIDRDLDTKIFMFTHIPKTNITLLYIIQELVVKLKLGNWKSETQGATLHWNRRAAGSTGSIPAGSDKV
jgi:hypothetical protein